MRWASRARPSSGTGRLLGRGCTVASPGTRDAMTPERWRQITEIFHAALARDPEVRDAFLDDACGADQAVEARGRIADGRASARPAHLATRRCPCRRTSRARNVARPISDRQPAWSRRDGRGLPRARSQARARRGHQGSAVALTADPERLARFEREARVLASLNHPHIGAIYGVEATDGVHALVMELVEGEDLAQRIARGPDSAGRRLADREADRRGYRSGARTGDHPSRSETREHQGARGRHGQSARLWSGEGRSTQHRRRGCDERIHVSGPGDRGRDHFGYTGAYVAGTGVWQSGGQAGGHLGVWRRVLRNADRPAALYGRDDVGDPRARYRTRTRRERVASNDAARDSGTHRPLSHQGSAQPSSGHRRGTHRDRARHRAAGHRFRSRRSTRNREARAATRLAAARCPGLSSSRSH